MKVILSHPTGNNFVRALAHSLSENDMLYGFYTSIATFQGTTLDRIGGIRVFSEIRRRRLEEKLRPLTHTWPWYEVGRLLAVKNKFNWIIRHEKGLFCLDAVYKNIDNHLASKLKDSSQNEANAVYAYEDGALATFKQAKVNGLKCFYDLPIAYWETGKKLMSDEAARHPDWAKTIGGGIIDSSAKLERKVLELELADAVIVPGQFVASSLPEWAKNKKIIIAPFGTPKASPKREGAKSNEREIDKRPLRVLFAGSMSQRKGLGDLFEAVKLVNSSNIQLVVMGSLMASMGFYKSKLGNFIYEGGRSNEQVLELMASCDIFCLPSIVEGRALVMQEAMSQELPIIITPNTGGADLVKEGITGFLVPIRSPQAIAAKLTWFLENRSKIPEMGRMAQEHASTYTWKNYGENIIRSLLEFF